MKRQFICACLAASLGIVGCGGSGNSGQQNSDSTAVEQSQEAPVVEEEKPSAENVFSEDVAKQVFELLKLKGFNFPSDRTPENYGQVNIWSDSDEALVIYCFKKTDGNILAYVYRFSECEGSRDIISKDFYTMADGKLTKTTQGIPFKKLKLDDFSDELGKLDFMMHSDFVEDHQKVWDDFSARVAKEYEIEYVNSNTVKVSPVYYNDYRGTFPMVYDWNGDEFVKSPNQKLAYADGSGFSAIRQGWPFPDLSSLKHYKATAKGDSMILKYDGETIATFEIKDNHVKDYVVYSSKYVDDDEAVPYKRKGEERTYAKHTFAPKTIKVTEYQDPDSWKETVTTYAFTYDDKNRVKTVSQNGQTIYEITYKLEGDNGEIIVDRYESDEFSEGGEPIQDVYGIENGKFSTYQHGECDAVKVLVKDGYLEGYDSDEITYNWFDGSWKSASCEIENWDCAYEYSHTSLDWYQDKYVINLLPLLTDGVVRIDASTFFYEGKVICRSEYLPKRVIFDGSNIQYVLVVGGATNSDGAYEVISTSDSKNNDRRFNRRINFEY